MIRKHDNGFTLIELAMVLFIITLILGTVMTPLSTRLEMAERSKADDMLSDIKESLIGYVLVNGHFPCPDCTTATGGCALAGLTLNNGIEDGKNDAEDTAYEIRTLVNTFDKCATVEGNLPWSTLGLPEFDPWENHFIYRVTEEFADDDDGTTGCTSSTANISFCLDSNGNININDENGASVAANVPAIVLTLGNDASTTGASQAENQNIDPVFISRDYSAATDQYDDLIIWISPLSLMYQMVRAERLP